jgi:hypothetical protein
VEHRKAAGLQTAVYQTRDVCIGQKDVQISLLWRGHAPWRRRRCRSPEIEGEYASQKNPSYKEQAAPHN